MRLPNRLKKFLIASGIVVPLCFINIANLRAQSSSGDNDYLAIIAQNTTAILEKVNALPQYIVSMVAFGLNWQTPDNSESTANMQASFDLLGQVLARNISDQNMLQTQLTADLVHRPIADFTNQPKPTILDTLSSINDLSYASMMGSPPVSKGTFSPYNYVKYASGGALKHVMPKPDWMKAYENDDKNFNPGLNPYQSLYVQYFNTIMAVESFGAYTLSNTMVDSQKGSQSTAALQNTLISQASSSSWIAQIASEELGKVLRQILIFQSQSYVLMTQLLQTQKQLLNASVMTNTLLILNNRTNETYIAAKAQGVTPSF